MSSCEHLEIIFSTFVLVDYKKNINAVFDNIIWRLFPDPQSKNLLIETRDEQRKRVQFHGLDLDSGEIISKFQSKDESWWLGIEGLLNGKALIHGFESEESPVHKGVTCYEIVSGDILWNYPDQQLLEYHANTIILKGDDDTLKIDWSGNVTSGEDLPIVSSYSVLNPNPYFQESEHFNTVSEFIKNEYSEQPVELIEYLEVNDLIIISYYISQNAKLANLLKVIDLNGNSVLEETLGSALKGIGINTFLLSQNQLIFTKNKTELISYII